MSALFAALKALGEVVFLVVAAPLLIVMAIAAMAVNDLLARFRRKCALPSDQAVSSKTVSVVIPTWNGREHLERNLPSVLEALAGNPDHEIVVVDNASTDGTAEWLREKFPAVRILSLDENRGFGGGSNAGFQHARNPIVLLLNNDMRVEKGLLAPIVEGFSDPRVFAVTAQIFFSDPAKRREETGLTRGLWLNGRLSVGHVIDEKVTDLFPTFYAGGGSSAYDRRKFLELGGFDPLWEPFYLEDTDISHMAWKRGWIVLYQPRGDVYHDRGTIGKHFSEDFIQRVLEKNHLLFAWKNIHEWPRLLAHFGWLYAGLWVRLLAGPATARQNSAALLRALGQFRGALRSPEGDDRRYRSVPAAAGRLLSRPLRHGRPGARETECSLRFALPDRASDAWRRSVHESNGALPGADRPASSALPARSRRRPRKQRAPRQDLRQHGVPCSLAGRQAGRRSAVALRRPRARKH